MVNITVKFIVILLIGFRLILSICVYNVNESPNSINIYYFPYHKNKQPLKAAYLPANYQLSLPS